MFKELSFVGLALLASTAHAAPDLTGWQHVVTNSTAYIYMSPKYMTKVGHKKVEA